MMMQMSGFELPIRAMRQQIALALDVIVQTSRMSDGTRKVTAVSEVIGIEDDTIALQDLFTFQRDGVDPQGRIVGRFVSTGARPRFADRAKISGHEFDREVLASLTS
jgi:pilus assembly protein CpaF